MAKDLLDVPIHDKDGSISIHKHVAEEPAEQAILAFDLVKDKPHMALIRAVLAAGMYNVGGIGIYAKRVPPNRDQEA